MDAKDLESFHQAVVLAQSGKKEAANASLKILAEAYPQDVNCFLWVAFTAPNISEAEKALEIAAILDPHNPSLDQAQEWLAQERAKQASQTNWPPTGGYTIPPNFNHAQSFTDYPNSAIPPQPQSFGYGSFQQPPMGYYQQPPVGYYPAPAGMYYQQPRMIPGVRMSGWAVFGYFIAYFIGCVVLLYGISFIINLIMPVRYNYYYRASYSGGVLTLLIYFLINLGTSIWATIDSARRRTKFGPASASHPVVVFMCCILFWTVAFALFLAGRRRSITYYGV
jgi:hypothetical protein